jgi:HK97 family phage major capsid protein
VSRLAEYCKDAQSRRDKVTDLFNEIDAKQEGVATPEQIDQIKSLNKEAEELEGSARKLEEQESLRAGNAKGLSWLKEPVRGLPFSTAQQGAESRGDLAALKSFGERFTDSDAFRDWLKSNAPNGDVPHVRQGQGIRLTSPLIPMEGVGFKSLIRDLPNIDPAAMKALVTGAGATSGGPFINIDYRGLLDRGTFERPLRIRDLVTVLETTSDTVEYVRLGAHTNAAAPVAEATATSGSSGIKPESTLVTAAVQDTIKTIATWIPATRRALQDAPQLRGLIDTFLRYALAEEVEDQIISGAGTGENFTGVLNTSGTTAQAFDTDLLTTYRKARTKVVLTGRAFPTAYVIHPNDWEDLDLLTDNEERYYFGGPVGVGVPRLWGVPVVESEAMTEGTAMLADWRLAVLWDRMQTAIYVSDSHSDFFIRNLIAILAELRAGFGLLRPAAFVEIALA